MKASPPVWHWPPDNRVEADAAQLLATRDLARVLPYRPSSGSGQVGPRHSRMRGRGMEFAETRPYQPGDDVRHIDWRVTARSTHTHTKLFQEERERPMLLWVDYRPAMHFATRGVFKSVLAARIAAMLAWRSVATGDRAGGLVFSEQAEVLVRPGRGQSAVLHLARQLATGPWRGHAANGPVRVSHTLRALQRLARPGSLVVMLSDFRRMNPSATECVHRIARHASVLLLQLFDPIEAELPSPGLYPVTDGQARVWLDSRRKGVRTEHVERFARRGQKLRELAASSGACWMQLSTDSDPLPGLRALCARRIL